MGLKNFTFSKNLDREEIIDKLTDLGFINETSSAKTFDKANTNIVDDKINVDMVEKLSKLKNYMMMAHYQKKSLKKRKKILD